MNVCFVKCYMGHIRVLTMTKCRECQKENFANSPNTDSLFAR